MKHSIECAAMVLRALNDFISDFVQKLPHSPQIQEVTYYQ